MDLRLSQQWFTSGVNLTTTSFQSRPLNGNLFLLRIIHGFVTETVLYLSPQPPVYFCWSNHHICSAAPPCTPWLRGVHLLCTPFAPPTTGAAPLGFGGAPLLHPPAPSQVLDFGILPMYLSFQVHLWSSVLWILEEYYNFS